MHAVADDTNKLHSGDLLLTIDLHPYAYVIDFGNTRDSYVEAFLDNLNWEIITSRLSRAMNGHAMFGQASSKLIASSNNNTKGSLALEF